MLTYHAALWTEEGVVLAKVIDFPGVIAYGNSIEEARLGLSHALVDMAETALLRGEALAVPDPAAVDEAADEMLITGQTENVVAAFSKTAREEDPPSWVLWGDKTLLADPHGIALDTKKNVIFVANFGSTATPRELKPLMWGDISSTAHASKASRSAGSSVVQSIPFAKK